MRRSLLLLICPLLLPAIFVPACSGDGAGAGTSTSSTGGHGPDASAGGDGPGGANGDAGSTGGGGGASLPDGATPDAGAPSAALLGTPSPATGSSAAVFQIPVIAVDGNPLTLEPSQVVLNGSDTVGCVATVLGSGTATPVIRVSGCAGNGPLTISTTACASPTVPACAAAAGPSTAVIVSNPGPDLPISGGTQYTYVGASGANVPFELWFPTAWETMPPLPVYFHIHGGGWSGGSASLDTALAQAIARQGFIVANLDYTLAPSYALGSYAPTPYSEGHDDINAFIHFATAPATLTSINADPSRVSIGGASAGAHLALVQATRTDAAADTFHFRCVVDTAGPTDLVSIVSQATLQATIDIVHGVYGADPPGWASPASNAASLRADRLLIMHAIEDSLVPFAQASQLVAEVAKAKPGVELTRNAWPDPNPDPSTPSHLIPSATGEPAWVAYLSSRCR